MRKLKKFVITSDVKFLTDIEQSKLLGGESTITGCEDKSQDQCSGECYIGTDRGFCGWSYADYNRCTCAVVTIG